MSVEAPCPYNGAPSTSDAASTTPSVIFRSLITCPAYRIHLDTGMLYEEDRHRTILSSKMREIVILTSRYVRYSQWVSATPLLGERRYALFRRHGRTHAITAGPQNTALNRSLRHRHVTSC